MKGLNKNSKIFLGIQGLFGLSAALSSTFVNIFMWRLTSSMSIIAYYNMAVSITIVANFIIAGYIGRKRGIITCLRIGIIANIAFYVSIVLLQEKAGNLLIPLGFLNGIGGGFYFYATNTLIFYLTDDKNRGYYLGVSGAIGAVMGTIAPLISGWIIVSGNKLKGYSMLFFLSFILFFIAIILSFFLHKVIEGKQYNLKKILNQHGNRNWRILMSTHLFAGLRDGSFNFALSLLTFMILKNELSMGKLSMAASILGISSTYLVGYILHKKNIGKIFFTGVILNIISTLIVIISPTFIGIIVNSFMYSIFNCFWAIPFSNIAYKVAEKCSDGDNNIGDYMIVREIPLAIGRILSLGMFLIINSNFNNILSIRIILFILSLMLIPMYFISFMHKEKDVF